MPSDDQRVGLKHPGLMLKYSTFKNLASLAVLRDDLETAMEFYLEVNDQSCSTKWKTRAKWISCLSFVGLKLPKLVLNTDYILYICENPFCGDPMCLPLGCDARFH